MLKLDLDKLKELRLKNNLSIEDMSSVIGLKSGSSYWRYETGVYKLRAEMLPALAKALNCDIEELFN